MTNVTDFVKRSAPEEMIDALKECDAWELKRTEDDAEPCLRVQIDGEWLEYLGPDPLKVTALAYREYLSAIVTTCLSDAILTKKMPV